jgi:hypothetical protein
LTRFNSSTARKARDEDDLPIKQQPPNVMAGLRPGHPRFEEDVDARNKSGHDER